MIPHCSEEGLAAIRPRNNNAGACLRLKREHVNQAVVALRLISFTSCVLHSLFPHAKKDTAAQAELVQECPDGRHGDMR